MTSLPSTHKALVVVEKGKVAVEERPIPSIGDDEILVRVRAVALNPTDWKHVDRQLKPGQSIGCDFAGDIAALGSNVENLNVGESVAGFIRGGFVRDDNGAFQEYVVTLPQLVWRKPDSLPYEDAAPMGGIALSTAAHALHQREHLSIPYEPISNPEPILIWGGSTGVGMYAIKLAALSGYKVVTVASKHNWDLVKSLGADAVFDYKDPEVASHIKQWAQSNGFSSINKGLDTISENGSVETSVSILSQGGKLVLLLPPPKDLDKKGIDVYNVLVYSVLKPKNTEDFAYITDWYKRLPSYIESGKLGKGVVPLRVLSGGLDDLPEALDILRQGKNSGEKVVVTLK